MSTGSLDAAVVLAIAVKLQQMLTDPATPDRTVSVPITQYVYQADNLRFSGARDTNQESTLAEFSELMNRIPTTPVWKPQASVHLWDIYSEVLGAQLAKDSLSPQERSDYEAAQGYLYNTVAGGARQPSATLKAYREARQAWLQASIDYRQAEAAGAAADDPAVRARWQDVDEPKLRQARDDAAAAWNINGHKDQVDEALRQLTELGARSPSAVWRRHRDTFNPSLADQFNTSPNGSRFAPTFFAPGNVLDAPWPRVELTREALLTLTAAAPQELTAVLGHDVGRSLQAVGFDYSVVSISRPWLDPVMELFASRSWKFPPSTPPLSDGGDHPTGRCPYFVETAILVRNIEVASSEADQDIVCQGDAWVSAGSQFDFDTGWTAGGSPDAGFGRVAADPEDAFRWMAGEGAKLASLRYEHLLHPGEPIDLSSFEGIQPEVLHHLTYQEGGEQGYLDLLASNGLQEIFAVLTTQGNLAKAQVLEFGDPIHIRWVTYSGAQKRETSDQTDAQDIYIAAVVCRKLPRCPDPDPNLPW
jgi:hypothetical protein